MHTPMPSAVGSRVEPLQSPRGGVSTQPRPPIRSYSVADSSMMAMLQSPSGPLVRRAQDQQMMLDTNQQRSLASPRVVRQASAPLHPQSSQAPQSPTLAQRSPLTLMQSSVGRASLLQRVSEAQPAMQPAAQRGFQTTQRAGTPLARGVGSGTQSLAVQSSHSHLPGSRNSQSSWMLTQADSTHGSPVGVAGFAEGWAEAVAAAAAHSKACEAPVLTTATRPQSPLTTANAPQSPPSSQAPLGVGACVIISGRRYRLTGPLGEGSFGTVWAARGEDGTPAAIKELTCSTESDLRRAREEAKLLQRIGSGPAVAGRVPTALASEVSPGSSPGRWRVRVAMTQLPGMPLEEFLEGISCGSRHPGGQRSGAEGLGAACRLAGELLAQLTPAIADLSEEVYHRDVTPRNILIDYTGTRPRYGLVDFGLATDARRWRSGEDGEDLGGDGRYWPAAAWFAFGHGTAALATYPALSHEYRYCLDMHALGLTALRCLMEAVPESATCNSPRLHAPAVQLRALRYAWTRYWADARRFWQPVYDAFRKGGDFGALKRAYVAAGVHNVISMDLRAIRSALLETHAECASSVTTDPTVAHLLPILDALLALLCPSRGDEEAEAHTFTLNNAEASPTRTSDCGATDTTASVISDSSPSRDGRQGGEPQPASAPVKVRARWHRQRAAATIQSKAAPPVGAPAPGALRSAAPSQATAPEPAEQHDVAVTAPHFVIAERHQVGISPGVRGMHSLMSFTSYSAGSPSLASIFL